MLLTDKGEKFQEKKVSSVCTYDSGHFFLHCYYHVTYKHELLYMYRLKYNVLSHFGHISHFGHMSNITVFFFLVWSDVHVHVYVKV